MVSKETANSDSKALLEAIQADPSPLISAAQLNDLLEVDAVKVFDVRGTWSTPARALPDDFLSGHIAGAAFLDWTKHFIQQDIPLGMAALAEREAARSSFGELGINAGDLVVLYDDNSHMMAGRIWIAMRRWGFQNVRVLDGGWKFWQQQGLPISTEEPSVPSGSFEPTDISDLAIDIDEFLTQRDLSCVIDARGAANFAGNPDDPRTGHIPGSVNVPFSTLLDSQSGVFLQNDALAEVLDERAPGWRSSSIIATCGSGYAATVLLLALHKMDQTGTLFDGSFAVWKQDPTRPVAQIT